MTNGSIEEIDPIPNLKLMPACRLVACGFTNNVHYVVLRLAHTGGLLMTWR